MTDVCKNCRWSIERREQRIYGFMARTFRVRRCRRFPQWVEVSDGHFCGEFEAREGERK